MPYETQALKDRTIAIAEAIPADRLGRMEYFYLSGIPRCLTGWLFRGMGLRYGLPVAMALPMALGWTQDEFYNVTSANDSKPLTLRTLRTFSNLGNREAGLAALRNIPVKD